MKINQQLNLSEIGKQIQEQTQDYPEPTLHIAGKQAVLVVHHENERIRKLGYFQDNKFHTTRKPEHWFYKYQGFGINKQLADELNKLNMDIIIEYTNKEAVSYIQYYAPIKKIIERNFSFRHRFETQYLVKKEDMAVIR